MLYPLTIMLDVMLSVNVVLAVFNFLPIPPLDGSHILEGLLPAGMQDVYARMRQYSFVILIVFLYYINLSFLYGPILKFFYYLLYGL